MKRRDFLRSAGTVAGSTLLGRTSVFSMAYTNTAIPEKVVNGMPRRLLGRTGRYVSMVGFPGLSLVHDELDQQRCTEAVHSVFHRGLNYFDVAPAYGDGKCEIRLGIALQGLDRNELFLACKTKQRDREGAQRELETSLERLKTDFFDLYQLHHVRSVEEARQALGPGGAMEAILSAREAGTIRHIGFSAHTTLGALELMRGFPFDTVMFPINFVELYNRGFGKEVLDLANQQGAAVISIKTMSWGGWPESAARTRNWWYRSVEQQEDVDLAWRFALSRQGVVAGIPPSFIDLTERAMEAVRTYRPPTEAELEKLQRMAAGCASLFEREEARYAPRQAAHFSGDEAAENEVPGYWERV